MAYTKASGKAVDRYCKKAYEDLRIRVKMGNKSKIQSLAESKGLSLNGYINSLIEKDMHSHGAPEEEVEVK